MPWTTQKLYMNDSLFVFGKLILFIELCLRGISQVYFQNNPKPTNSFMDTRPLKYPLCPIESHAQEPLSRICLDKGCTEKVPVCCICEF